MALPSSGQLGMNDIRVELGISSQSPFSLDTAENGGYVALNNCSPSKPNPSNPAAISEWYSYNHTATCYSHGTWRYDPNISCPTLCNSGGTNVSLWSCCSTLTAGCSMWWNSTCSTVAEKGSYSNGTTCFEIPSNNNVIGSISNCPTPTPTPTATPTPTPTATATPTPTPTATATPTPTPTPTSAATPTPTPTPNNIIITVYTKQNTNGVGSGYQVYYRLNGCSGKGVWQQLTCGSCPTSDSCSACSGTISASSNQDISIAILDCSSNGIAFNATDNSSTCPSNANNYCDAADCTGTPFTFNSGTSNKDIAINVYTGKLGYLLCL